MNALTVKYGEELNQLRQEKGFTNTKVNNLVDAMEALQHAFTEPEMLSHLENQKNKK